MPVELSSEDCRSKPAPASVGGRSGERRHRCVTSDQSVRAPSENREHGDSHTGTRAPPRLEAAAAGGFVQRTICSLQGRIPRWIAWTSEPLGVRLDEDFVETIFGEARDACLAHVLVDAAGLLADADDTLVLVHANAIDRGETLKSTPSLRYLGPRAPGATAR